MQMKHSIQKKHIVAALLTIGLLLQFGCGATAANTPMREDDIVAVTLDFQKQSGYASNQFAVWIEDANGALVRTLFVTQFTVNGGFEKRPDAIPVWVERSGIAQGENTDTTSGATPKSGSLRYVWDLTDNSGNRVPEGTYTYYVEGTLRWKNHVLFSGEIILNGEAASSEAVAQYLYEASQEQVALTDAAPERDMIQNVTATYIPPSQA